MKNKIILFISFLLLLIVVLTPAKLVLSFIPEKSGININGLSGTVWSGNVDHLLLKDWSLSEITFNTQFLSLLSGKLDADINILKGDLVGQFSFKVKNGNNIELANANIRTQLSKFDKHIPFKGIELKGDVETKQLDLKLVNSKPTYISGSTAWKNGAVGFNGTLWQLGDFEIIWKTNDDGSIDGEILKKENKLDIQGSIKVSNKGLLEFNGSIATDIEKPIFTAFQFFANGKPSNGRQPLKFKKKIW